MSEKIQHEWTKDSIINFETWAAIWVCRGYVIYATADSMIVPFVSCELYDGVLYSLTGTSTWDVDNPVGAHENVVWRAEHKSVFERVIEKKANKLAKYHDKLSNSSV